MSDQPPLPPAIWSTLSAEAQAAVLALVASFERRIAALEERLGKDSTNSSKPPSSDPPSVKRRPPAPASGRKRGGQPGHRRHRRALVPPEEVREAFECKPARCRRCGHELHGDDPEPIRHQVAELEAPVEEVRRHVREAGSAHIDETSWRQGRRRAWLWAAVTRTATAFTIAPTRGAEVARKILGTAAGKVVVSDRFTSYGWIKRRQFCRAHTIRTQSTTRSITLCFFGAESHCVTQPRRSLRGVA